MNCMKHLISVPFLDLLPLLQQPGNLYSFLQPWWQLFLGEIFSCLLVVYSVPHDYLGPPHITDKECNFIINK